MLRTLARVGVMLGGLVIAGFFYINGAEAEHYGTVGGGPAYSVTAVTLIATAFAVWWLRPRRT